MTRSARSRRCWRKWTNGQAAETCYAAALDADDGVSPFPCGQLLFEWGVGAMRRGDLDRAEAIFVELDAILPAHVPGTGASRRSSTRARTVGPRRSAHHAAARDSDDPEYRATYAEILAARGEQRSSTSEAERAAASLRVIARATARSLCRPCGRLLHGRRQPTTARSLSLPGLTGNCAIHPRSRSLLARARRIEPEASLVQERAA